MRSGRTGAHVWLYSHLLGWAPWGRGGEGRRKESTPVTGSPSLLLPVPGVLQL